MIFNKHLDLEGLHAPFSPSQSAWLRYDDDKALEVLANKKSAALGTRLHAWAKETIDLGIKQSRSKATLNTYVNDAISFKMNTEVVLKYSDWFFGTADAISFRNGTLRIHDLKTGKVGKIDSHVEQLEIYAALFCLEYKYEPIEINIELRVYKNDEVIVHNPDPDEIVKIMKHIIRLNTLLEKTISEEG